MKKRIVKQALCTVLITAMLASNTSAGWAYVPGVGQNQSMSKATFSNAEKATPTDADKAGGGGFSKASASEAKKQWEISNTGRDEVFEVLDDGSFHFKSGTGNDNANNPAILLSKEYKSITDGTLSFTVTPNDVPANTRFGVYLRYHKAAGGNPPHQGIFVGFDTTGWFWQKYDGAGNAWYTGTRKAAPGKGESAQVTIELNGDTMNVTIDGESVFANEPVPTLPNPGGIAFKAGSWGSVLTDVALSDISFEEPATETFQVSGKITAEGLPVMGASVTLGSQNVTTKEDGTYSFQDVTGGERILTVAKAGFVTVTHPFTLDADVSNLDFVLTAVGDGVVIKSETMEVTVDAGFPRAIQYSYKGKLMAGQEKPLDTFTINGVKVKPEVTSTVTADKIEYVMTFLDKANKIDAIITAEFVVKDNTLEFNITNIEDNRIVKTIDMSGNNLISVKGTSESAAFAGSNMANNTRKSGDTFSKISDLGNGKKGYMYAFVSDGTLSGGLWSNSENNVNADWQRVTLNVTTEGNVKNAGLSSTYWTYQRGENYRKEDGTMELDDGTILPVDELPSAKVAITDDVNEDGTADWQDGAIAYRSIMNNPQGSELVPELVAYRINMTFGSQAQNPFLMALDGVKKISLNTGGLGQSILLKGYGSEGHDSGHLNYADIGQRIGGPEDMKTLMAKGKEYGAVFGIHVNASETYPESKYFDEDRLSKNSDGSYYYGWNWLDQGININADYDLRHGRAQRFKDLYDELGGPDNDLNWVYVDVWGNGQSGDNGTWPSRQLAKEITALGWNVAGEWGHANEYDSIFQHWAADLTYGGNTSKGINSNVARFIRNHQKDSWVGNFPSYGGAAEAPLFGGYNMKDFEGWQGRSDYKAYINNLFEVNIASKYVQHFLTTNIKYGTPVTIQDESWTPEMELVLKSREADRNDVLTITRKSNDYTDDRDGYRSRIFELNGKRIFDGQEGDAVYLIPWIWDNEGNVMDPAEQKLYHWNTKGGTTTWELPEGWEDVNSVYAYELTELGKTNESVLAVNGGRVTLTAEAQTPYIIYQGEMVSEEVTWSEGMHIVDSGFNSESLDAWTVTGDGASVVKSQGSNPMLAISDNTEEVSISQTLTDLEPNTKYVAYVGVDNRSDTAVTMEIDNGDAVALGSAPRSIARNFVQAYAHNTRSNTATVDNTSYFQHMYVFFETGADPDIVTLAIKRAPGEGTTYLDDIRIVANESNNYPGEGVFVQDFETVPQGIWPFVVGNRENVTDNRTHLSELHVPYTQRGWNGKAVSDVIQGTWSVKTNGLAGAKGLIYQTIPQNFKFEPGVDYVVSFDYESGSDDTYAVVTGSKPYENGGSDTQMNLKNTIDLTGPGKVSFTLTGADDGQSWFGIISTGIQADTRGVTNGNQINFNGYKDFMLDNLVISTASGQKDELRTVIAQAQLLSQENFDAASWEALKFALDTALIVNDDVNATQQRVDEAVKALKKAMGVLVQTGNTITGTVTDTDGSPVKGVEVYAATPDGKQLTAYTAADGTYRIPGGTFGENTVSIDDKAYEAATERIVTSAEGGNPVLDFVLTPAFTSITGKVTAAGVPAGQTGVTIKAGGGEQTVQTDGDGKYRFDNVRVYPYEMTVTKAGYDTVTVNVETSKAYAAVKDVMLQPATGAADYVSNWINGTTFKNLPGNSAAAAISADQGKTRLQFTGGSHTNVYDSAAPAFKNGCVEMDIQVPEDTTRTGIILRATDNTHRVFVGTGDVTNQWFVEYWNGANNQWSDMYVGPALTAGTSLTMKAEIIDRNVKLWLKPSGAPESDYKLVIDKTMNSGMQMEPGYVGINSSRESRSLTVNSLKVTSYDLPVGSSQTVVGRILNEDGTPAANVPVKLAVNTRVAFEKTANTNGNGEYKFKNVPEGRYTITAFESTDNEMKIPIGVEAVPYYVLADTIVLGAPAPVIKSGLLSAIANAKNIVTDGYTAATAEALKAAIANAEAVADNTGATQEEVDAAAASLQKAVEGLIEAADKKALNVTINLAMGLDESLYTPESWEKFEQALTAASTAANDDNAAQEQVDQALSELNDAIRGLTRTEPAEVNWDALKTQIQVAEELIRVLDKADYTKESYQAVVNALNAAKALKEGAAQADVDKAEKAIEDAIAGLVKAEKPEPEPQPQPGVDKTVLAAAIETANTLSSSKYTESSWNVFKTALAEAWSVLKNPDAAEAEVKAAADKLKEAQNALVERPSSGGSSSGGSSSGGSYSSGSVTVKKGNATQTMDWKQNAKGWWLEDLKGNYPKNEWIYALWNGQENWYYFDAEGYMVTGWLESNGKKYFLHNVSDGRLGHMYTGWHQIDGSWYYFNEVSDGTRGALLTSTTTPDGYQVGSDGKWIP